MLKMQQNVSVYPLGVRCVFIYIWKQRHNIRDSSGRRQVHKVIIYTVSRLNVYGWNN